MPCSTHTKIIVALVNYLTHKNAIVEDADKISDGTQQFKHDYILIQCTFDNLFEMHKFSKSHNCICYTLLAHRAEKGLRDNNKCGLKDSKDTWEKIKKLSKERPRKIKIQRE